MNTTELKKLAEAVEELIDHSNGLQQELEALKRAISDAEPVAVLTMFDIHSQTGTVDLCGNWQELRVGDSLYTHPTQQAKPQPLTHEQKWEMWTNVTIEQPSGRGCYFRGVEDAEAKHGIK